jgi:glycine dehydrogenase subunit 2
LRLIDTLAHWIKTLTGMPAVAMSPAAGAHGELCGLMAARAALEARGDARKRVLVPDSAHGTNPATAAICGYAVEAIPLTDRGRVDLAALKDALDEDVAAFMLTNPNTCGLFEDEILEMAEAVHDAGAFFYCDGANFNAIVGRVRPGDLGIDCMHLNLHKTFSTPHGGGGPGSGPVVLSEALAPYAPLPWVVAGKDGFKLVEHSSAAEDAVPYGRMKAFHGQMGMFVRALAYMMSHGSDGLLQASSDAVLNANYLLVRLSDVLTLAYDGPCMHEVLFDDGFLKGTGVTTLDFAKAMIDEGFHPMTMYFPLVVHGALLMEPTETESRESLDQFIDTIRNLAERANGGEAAMFHAAPVHTPRRRLDETAAARRPVLRWRPEEIHGEAAE